MNPRWRRFSPSFKIESADSSGIKNGHPTSLACPFFPFSPLIRPSVSSPAAFIPVRLRSSRKAGLDDENSRFVYSQFFHQGQPPSKLQTSPINLREWISRLWAFYGKPIRVKTVVPTERVDEAPIPEKPPRSPYEARLGGVLVVSADNCDCPGARGVQGNAHVKVSIPGSQQVRQDPELRAQTRSQRLRFTILAPALSTCVWATARWMSSCRVCSSVTT